MTTCLRISVLYTVIWIKIIFIFTTSWKTYKCFSFTWHLLLFSQCRFLVAYAIVDWKQIKYFTWHTMAQTLVIWIIFVDWLESFLRHVLMNGLKFYDCVHMYLVNSSYVTFYIKNKFTELYFTKWFIYWTVLSILDRTHFI